MSVPAAQVRLPEGYRAGERGLHRASLSIFLAGVAVFAMLYEPQALLPELARVFDIGAAGSTLSISVSTGSLAVGLLVLGPLSDRRGRTTILLASLGAAAVLAVLIALAPSWPVLLGLRGLQGFALAGLPAVGVAYLREELHPSVSSRAIGLYIAGNAIGGLTGRLLGGLLTDLAGWRTRPGRGRRPGGGLRGRRPGAAAAGPAVRAGGPLRVPAALAGQRLHRPGAADALRRRGVPDGRLRRGLQRGHVPAGVRAVRPDRRRWPPWSSWPTCSGRRAHPPPRGWPTGPAGGWWCRERCWSWVPASR